MSSHPSAKYYNLEVEEEKAKKNSKPGGLEMEKKRRLERDKQQQEISRIRNIVSNFG